MEDPEPSMLLIGIAACLLILAFTSAVDAAFTSISRYRLNALRAGQGAKVPSWLTDDPVRIKSTILILNTLSIIIASALTLDLASPYTIWGSVLSLSCLLLVMLVVCEVLPKAIATRNPTLTARLLSGPIGLLITLLWPLTWLVNITTRPLFSLISGQDAPSGPLISEEELRLMVNASEETGVIKHEAREMIESVMSFGETLVREIMVPRVDITAIDVDSSLDEALTIVIAEGHSRIPVYDGTLDRVVGILYAKDLLPALREGNRTMSLRSLLRPARFVPETIRVNALLADIQKRKVHIAIAVDEYGGVSGLATIEDLVELIVGEIQDEYDSEDPLIQEIEPGVFLVDATVPIDDISGATGLAMEAEDVHRIGGLVTETLGRVPKVGDVVQVGEAVISVLSMKGLRLQQLRIWRRPAGALNGHAPLRAEGEAHGTPYLH